MKVLASRYVANATASIQGLDYFEPFLDVGRGIPLPGGVDRRSGGLREVPQNCRFFQYKQRAKKREVIRYLELVDLKGEDALEMLPFSSIARRPPVLAIQR